MLENNKIGAEKARGKYVMRTVTGVDDPDLTDPQKDLLKYFADKTGGQRLPRWSDLVPGDIAPHLPKICVVDITYDGNRNIDDVTHRYVGTGVAGFYGDLTGKSISDYSNRVIGGLITGIIDDIVESRKPIIYYADPEHAKKQSIRVNNLFVPLADDGTDVDKVFFHLSTFPEHWNPFDEL